MSVSLQKGQKVSLTKDNAGLGTVVAGLGWDEVKKKGGFLGGLLGGGGQAEIDCDASALLLRNGKLMDKKDIIFFGNLTHPSGTVRHMGDNLTGAGDGDDEQIKVDLAKLPPSVTHVAFTATIYDAEARRQNFGMVNNAFIRIYNEATGEELLRYDLGEDFSIETAVVFGELYRNNGEWKFNAIGSGYQGGLAALCANYGVDVE